jgi:hypothetical protein
MSRWKNFHFEELQNLGLCLVLKTFKQGGIFIVQHLLGPRFFWSHPKDHPMQSPLTTHNGMGRIYSNLDPRVPHRRYKPDNNKPEGCTDISHTHYHSTIWCAMVVLLNLTVLIIFIKSKAVREKRHYNLVLFLSVSDLTTGLSGMFNCLRLIIPAWSEALLPCMISVVLVFVWLFMSLFQTFLIGPH